MLGMESQFLAYLKTVFSGYCFSVDFIHWHRWLNRTHCVKSFYGHDICFVKVVRMLSCMSFCIYAICLMTPSCTLLQANHLCVDCCSVHMCVVLCCGALHCCFIFAEVVPHLACVWCTPSLMVFIAASIVSQKICLYVYMWNCKMLKNHYLLICWLLSLQVDFFFCFVEAVHTIHSKCQSRWVLLFAHVQNVYLD
jgi:hypothetical protein